MKHTASRRVADILINLLIFASVLTAVADQYGVFYGAAQGPGPVVFRYFTTDSNLLAAFCSLVWAVWSYRHAQAEPPRWLTVLRLAGTASVTLTMVITACFLAPMGYLRGGMAEALSFYSGGVFILHLVAPLLALISFVSVGREGKLPMTACLWGMVPMMLYSFVYLIQVVLRGVWPDFYGFTFGGQKQLVVPMMLAVYALTFGLAAALRGLRGLRGKKEA